MIIFHCQCDALDKQIKMENYQGNQGEKSGKKNNQMRNFSHTNTTSKYFVRTSKLLTSKMPHNFCRKSSVNVHGALSDWNFASIFIERNGWITFFACSFQMCVSRRCVQCDSMHIISSIWYFRSSIVFVSTVTVLTPFAIEYWSSAYR